MRKHSKDIINNFLDKVSLAGKTRTKEIRLPYSEAVDLNLALTELLSDLHDKRKSAKLQEQQPNVPTTWFKVPVMVDCAPLPMIVEMVAKQYSEKPFVTGSQMVQWPNGRVIPAGMTFTANAESGTWTLTANFSDGIACVIANGGNMAPFIDAEKTKIKY